MKLPIVGVGHNCLDNLCTVEHYPPEDGSTHITSISLQGGGAVATAMAAAARLGVPSAVIGYLGDDSPGDEIVSLLHRDGVETSFIRKVPGGRSSVSYIMISPGGARTKFPYPDQLPPIHWDAPLIEAIRQAKVLHLDGTNYENAVQAAKIAKEAGVPVSLDGCHMEQDNSLNRRLASMADILIMNAKYPTRVAQCENYEQALLELAGWGPRIVIGTQGNQGCLAVIEGQVRHFPAFSVQTVDTTGAGDVFHGAFLVGWLRGMPLEENIPFASGVSALKCTRLGGRQGIPTMAEVEAFLSQRRESGYYTAQAVNKKI